MSGSGHRLSAGPGHASAGGWQGGRARRADLRLLAPTLAAWAACWGLAPAPSWPAALALWAGCALALAAALRWQPAGVLALGLAAAALCASLIASRPPAELPARVDATAVTTEAVTTETAAWGAAAQRIQFEAMVEAPSGGQVPALVFFERDPGPGRGRPGVDASLGGTPFGGIPLGSTVQVTGRAVPGDDRIRALIYAEAVRLVEPPPPWIAWGGSARTALLDTTAGLPGAGGQLLPGLAVGDTSRVGPLLDRAMRSTSLSHLTAVSGANCAIVAGLALLALRRLSLPIRVLGAVAALAAFVVVVTPQPSVLRASVMAGIALVALARGRPAAGLPLLGLTVLILLLVDPWLAREYGFALSVLATGGLLLLAPALARRLERRLPPWLALAVAIPISAQLACQPVLLMLEPSLPVYGVIANLLAAPAAPLATVLGLAACAVAVVLPAAGAVVAWLGWVPAAWIGAVAEFFAGLPLAALPWPAAPLGVIAFVGAVALIRVAPRTALVVWVLILAVGAGLRLAEVADRPADWQFAMCDVGQGDATLATGDGLVLLVDTGPQPQELADCLSRLGIRRIDLLVLTHFDQDHVGGLDAITGRVDRVLHGPPGGPEDEAVLRALALGGARVESAADGTAGALGGWRWRVLWPRARAGPGNDASLVLTLEPVRRGALCAILLGDLGAEAQQSVLDRLRRQALPDVDVVKVAHHGSADQSDALYRRLRAPVGLIGVGADNRYGHPAAGLLDTLEAAGTTAFRTDRHGLILVTATEDGTPAVWTQRRSG